MRVLIAPPLCQHLVSSELLIFANLVVWSNVTILFAVPGLLLWLYILLHVYNPFCFGIYDLLTHILCSFFCGVLFLLMTCRSSLYNLWYQSFVYYIYALPIVSPSQWLMFFIMFFLEKLINIFFMVYALFLAFLKKSLPHIGHKAFHLYFLLKILKFCILNLNF